MKTAVLTLSEFENYQIDFFDGDKLFSQRIWSDRSRVRDTLRQAGVNLPGHQGPRKQWWPLRVGEAREFAIDNPTKWFWTEN